MLHIFKFSIFYSDSADKPNRPKCGLHCNKHTGMMQGGIAAQHVNKLDIFAGRLLTGGNKWVIHWLGCKISTASLPDLQ